MVACLVFVLKYLLESKNGAIYQGTFLVDWNSASFCLALGITDNVFLSSPLFVLF